MVTAIQKASLARVCLWILQPQLSWGARASLPPPQTQRELPFCGPQPHMGQQDLKSVRAEIYSSRWIPQETFLTAHLPLFLCLYCLFADTVVQYFIWNKWVWTHGSAKLSVVRGQSWVERTSHAVGTSLSKSLIFSCSHLVAAIESVADQKLFETFTEVLGPFINSFRVINPSFLERINEEHRCHYTPSHGPHSIM